MSGTAGTVVIPAGQTSVTITLTALKDNVPEKQEVVVFTVTGGAHGHDSAKVFIEKQKGPGKGKKHGP